MIPLDPDLERTLRRIRRAPVERETVEMGEYLRNANQRKNVEQPRFVKEDVRAENFKQAKAWNMDFTTSLRNLFAPVVISSHS